MARAWVVPDEHGGFVVHMPGFRSRRYQTKAQADAAAGYYDIHKKPPADNEFDDDSGTAPPPPLTP